MDIVDSHHHLWDLAVGRYPWLQGPPIPYAGGDYADLRRDYRIEDYLADIAGHGIAASVHVEADWDPNGDPAAETAWLQAIAGRHGYPHAIVAQCDLGAPDVAAQLARHGAHRNLRGVRNLRPGPSLPKGLDAAAMFDHPDWRRGFALLGPRNLSYDMRMTPREAASALRLARDFPQTTIVITHLGYPPAAATAEAVADWRGGLAAMAACPNVVAKLSGFGMYSRQWTVAMMQPWVDALIDEFGPQRCMYGSNYPVDRLGAPYARIMAAMAELLARRDAGARAAIMGGTARRVYRI
ncbi:MAG: amidohydrolase family protein [Alphaproteobacteria bacterium]|nr:amidohydrolase family protein [Alphaproteobacteria bacterium]